MLLGAECEIGFVVVGLNLLSALEVQFILHTSRFRILLLLDLAGQSPNFDDSAIVLLTNMIEVSQEAISFLKVMDIDHRARLDVEIGHSKSRSKQGGTKLEIEET